MKIMEYIHNYHSFETISANFNRLHVSCIVGVLLVALFLLNRSSRNKYKLPPGPRIGIPLLGYLPFLTRNPHKKFTELYKKYGNVCGFYLGTKYTVVLGDYDAIKEALFKDEILGRPETNIMVKLTQEPSLVDTNGPIWREQRRFALQQLKDLGLGKSKMEAYFQEEISHFIKEIQKHNGEPFNVADLLEATVANNIAALLFGHRYNYDDPKIIDMCTSARKVVEFAGQTSLYVFMPWLAKLRTFLRLDKSTKMVMKTSANLRKIIMEEVEEHKRTVDEGNIRDYMDGYILEMRKREADPLSCFNESFLRGNSLMLFLGAVDTTKSTISWLLTLMAAYPAIQQKVYEEIAEIIGKSRKVVWSDHITLPYTEAVISEAERFRNVFPIGVVRCAMADCRIQGYDIPKDTVIFTNLWSLHHDPKYWKDPEEFVPKRFLSEDGKRCVKNEKFLPFTSGKRSCPGEQMAKMQIFLYFVSMVQNYEIVVEDGKQLDMEGFFGATLHQLTLDVVFRKRQL